MTAIKRYDADGMPSLEGEYVKFDDYEAAELSVLFANSKIGKLEFALRSILAAYPCSPGTMERIIEECMSRACIQQASETRSLFEKWYVDEMRSFTGPLVLMENGQYLYVQSMWAAYAAGWRDSSRSGGE